jgi:hypothetical protein
MPISSSLTTRTSNQTRLIPSALKTGIRTGSVNQEHADRADLRENLRRALRRAADDAHRRLLRLPAGRGAPLPDPPHGQRP